MLNHVELEKRRTRAFKYKLIDECLLLPLPTFLLSAVKDSKVVDISQAQLLDGLFTVNQPNGLLMSGDAQTGTLYLIDIQKHTANAVLQRGAPQRHEPEGYRRTRSRRHKRPEKFP